MHPNLSPTASSLSFVIISIISAFIILIPPCFCDERYQYITCGASFHCANIQNMSYPFWGLNRPDYCGRSAFQLTNCRGDIALITIGSISYRVLSLNEPTRSLTVARADLWNDTCPTFLLNTSLDSSHFISSSNNQILALYYRCTTVTGQFTTSQNQFNCTVNGNQSVSYFRPDVDPINSNLATCKNSIRVPVNATWGQVLGSTSASMRDLEAALAGGFGVEWSNDTLCNQCQASGGRCGSNTSSGSFACYCADGAFDSRCNTRAQYGSSKEPFEGLGMDTSVVKGALVVTRSKWLSHQPLSHQLLVLDLM